jgi:hypothetical protein
MVPAAQIWGLCCLSAHLVQYARPRKRLILLRNIGDQNWCLLCNLRTIQRIDTRGRTPQARPARVASSVGAGRCDNSSPTEVR